MRQGQRAGCHSKCHLENNHRQASGFGVKREKIGLYYEPANIFARLPYWRCSHAVAWHFRGRGRERL